MSVRLSPDPLAPSINDSLSTAQVSFRDPGGRVVIANNRAFRVVSDEYKDSVIQTLKSECISSLVSSGVLIESRIVSEPEVLQQAARLAGVTSDAPLILEHEHLDFPTYPYEWPPEMLYAAAELTLDLIEELLPHGFGLKDATPYNLLFRSSKPIFVDLLSIERRDPLDPTWLAYAQFVRTFIRPLLVNKYFGMGLDQVFRVYRDGLQPELVYRMAGWWRRVRPPFLTLVSLPTVLAQMSPQRYQSIYNSRRVRSAEQASFILGRQLKGLRRKLRSVKPSANRDSTWTNYIEQEHQETNLEAKEYFVKETLAERSPARVLDIGCNVGHFSELAARAGARVVAIDQDPAVVGRVWRRANESKLEILSLVIDITRPPGGLGWRNEECRGFLDRAVGVFDCVLVLAVLHHMLVTERIPLPEILKLVRDLSKDVAIVEFVAPADPMFRILTRGNDALYDYLSREHFEAVVSEFFVIERSQQIGKSHRWIYQLRRLDVV